MQVIIPASGLGTRFSNAGFEKPKPFIDVFGLPMIERVIENLGRDNEFVVLFRKEHKKYVHDWLYLQHHVKNIQIVWVDKTTRGAAETVLMAEDWIRPYEPVFVANSDQLLKGFDLWKFFYSFKFINGGGIVTFTPKPHDPKWSYVKVEDDKVIEVVEKKVVSNIATIGIYGWTDSFYLFDSIRSMIKNDIRTNNEYYLAPSYNQLIGQDEIEVRTYHVDINQAIGLGTPEDLSAYLEHHK